ncbi:MAG: ATP-binding protein [Akkermansiaceae bacterium]|jgi:two-component system phosphate regulon sensor histidine kinase PhoR
MNYFAYSCALVFLVLLILASRQLAQVRSELTAVRRKAKERTAKRDKRRDQDLQELLDALPHPFFSIDQDGTITRCNLPAREILGNREILDRPMRQIFLDADLINSLGQAIESGEVSRDKLRLPSSSVFSAGYADKESYWEMDVRPIKAKGGKKAFQVVMRDITPGVQSDQVRQDFVANASHELRTPLSIISGYLENLSEEDGLDDKELASRMLDTMVRHVTRINRIVEDMLVISRLESNDSAPLKLAPFRFEHCVEDVVARLDLVISKQNAKVKVDVPDFEIVGDQFYWTQILFNLVENALKQNPNIPLKIKIKARLEDDGQFTVRISDNGIGIPANDLPFIFKRFYRVEKHHSQNQVKGTGLGLSIVLRAIEAHKGTISATSTPGVETTFVIKTPMLKVS